MLEVTSPFDGRALGTVAAASEVDVDEALSHAHALFSNRRSWIPTQERIGILERTARIMMKHHGELVALATSEGGKPLLDSQTEVTCAIDAVRQCVDHLRTDTGGLAPSSAFTSSSERLTCSHYEPVGVVIALSTFSHPLYLIVNQAAAAIAAGCPVVLKPATVTPLSCLRFAEILRSAGLPDHWLQVIITPVYSTIRKMVTDPRVGLLSFIGTAQVGWALRAQLAPGVRCTLHQGSSTPVIIAPDADLELAITSVVQSSYYHAGQVCGSVQKVFVPENMSAVFGRRLAVAAGKLTVGDPMSTHTQVGPLIQTQETARVHAWVEEAVAGGAECLQGGEPISDRLYACTVLLNPTACAKVSRLEILGPVVNVYGYTDFESAVENANSLAQASQAVVFTRALDVAMGMFSQLDVSVVRINDALRIDGMPFAVQHKSSFGTGGIHDAINAMRTEKLLVFDQATAY